MSLRPFIALTLAMLCATVCLPGSARAAKPQEMPLAVFDRRESAELDRLVRDVCRKDLVVLGEDANHGGGRTLEVKAELLRRLVARCGFGAVVFESSLYETLDYERALAAGTADETRLIEAAGQLWFWAQEARPMAAWLHAQARAGRVRVAGMDVQPIGATARHARAALGTALSSALDDARAAVCRAEFDRHHAWAYDDDHPFDDGARQRLRDCSDAILAALRARGEPPASSLTMQARAYARYLDMALGGEGDPRDLGMFESLQWHRARWPTRTKIVVWCATVHAARRLDGVAPAMQPFGAHVHAAWGDRVATVGFSALGGASGTPGGRGAPIVLPPAPEDALERVALEDDRRRTAAVSDIPMPGLRYVDRRRLRAYGTIAARAINYRTVHAAPWHEIVDAMIVLREERPIQPIPLRTQSASDAAAALPIER
jgi:erythromycin esterase-like protein